jgi:hypothetical protein
MLLLEDIHSHWRFVKSLSSIFESVDLVLLIKKSVVVKSRDRSIKFIIEFLNQTNLLKSFDQEINSQEEAFTQRNSSQFEIIENIVTEWQTVFVRERVDNRYAAEWFEVQTKSVQLIQVWFRFRFGFWRSWNHTRTEPIGSSLYDQRLSS